MKKILGVASLFLLGISFVNANIKISNGKIIQKNEEVIKELKEKLDLVEISYWNTKKESIKWYELLVKKSDIKVSILEKELQNYYLFYCHFNSNEGEYECSKENHQKINITKTNLSDLKTSIEIYKNKLKELNIEVKQEKARIQKEKERMQKEKEKFVEESIREGEEALEQKNYSSAIKYFKVACINIESYNCNYGIAIANYKLAQQYYQDMHYHGYQQLLNNAKQDAIKYFKKAMKFKAEEKGKLENLIKEIEEYPDKEKDVEKEDSKEDDLKKIQINSKTTEEIHKEKLNAKTDKILKRLEKLTEKMSTEKKKEMYIKLIPALEKYKMKIKNTEILEILDILILKLKSL